jgi:filamentous hemagglutinin family protein
VEVFPVVGSTHRADGGQAKSRSRLAYRALLLLSTALVPVSASANPTGGSVVAGAATISRGGNTLTVNQISNRAIVNWRSFSIGAGETTQIRQPSSTSAILNRVTGANPSALLGHLTSNGQVYLINPNGIVVGPNGTINTAAFVASTLNVPDAAFMAGGAMTFAGDSDAGIRVLGSIQATNGDVILVAVAVDNKGRITAPNGQAILAAGGQVLYVPDGQSDIVIKASSSAPASVSNSGTIAAAAVQLKAAGSPYALAVNDSGMVSATAVHQIGGRVVLDGGDGDTRVSGAITAQAGDAGGIVTVTGKHVTLGGSAVVDASGPTGGGTVAIGGGKHGADPKVANADTTDIEAGAQIKVNATTKGNGGAVTVWGDQATQFAGTIEAKGGPDGGDGGDVEVSGGALVFHGTVDAQAPHGKQGRLLLDPTTIDIDTATASSIETALQTSDTKVAASNSVTVDAAITSAATNSLILQAPTIAVNADISLPNGTLRFDSDSEPGLSVSSTAGAAITALNLDVAGSFPTIDLEGPVTASTFSLSTFGSQTSLTATNGANSIGALSFGTPDAPNVMLTDSAAVTSSTAMTVSGALSAGGDIALTSDTAMTVSGSLSADGDITFVSAGDLTMEAGAFLAAGDTATLASTGGVFVNDAGTTLLGGNGRALIYTANTNGAFTDGGLAFPQFQSVSYPNDPQSGLQDVTYVGGTPILPMLTITAEDIARLYGDADPAFTASFSGGTIADLTSPVQFHLLQTNDLNVGIYTIVPFGATSSIDQLSYVNGTLTVNPAPLVIVADGGSQLYGFDPVLSASYHGLKNGDTSSVVTGLTIATTVTSASDVGHYAIDVSGGSAANYTITDVDSTLSVLPVPLTITARDVTVLSGAALPAFSASYAGLVNGDDPSTFLDLFFSTNATPISFDGTYTISLIGAGIGSRKVTDYALNFVPGTLRIVPRPAPPTVVVSNTIILPIGQDTATITAVLSTNFNANPTTVTASQLTGEQVRICSGCATLGNGPQNAEFNSVVNAFVAAMAGATQPPVTYDSVAAALGDPNQSTAMMGTLMPFVYTDLSTILNQPQSQWTPQQAAFVQSIQSYIQAQKQAAMQQAEADYQAWATQQEQQAAAQIKSVSGLAQIQEIALLSTNPPVPPASILQEAQLGFSLNNQQLSQYAAIVTQAGQVGTDLQDAKTSVAGFMPGAVADVAKVASAGFALTGSTASATTLVKLAPALETILPNAAKSVSRALAQGNKLLQIASTAEEVKEAQQIISDASEGVKAAEAGASIIPGADVIVEVAGNALQAGIAAAEYSQIGQFNQAFSAASGAAQQPTTVADLQQMVQSSAGQQQLFGYLTAMAATGGNLPAVAQPTMSLQSIITTATGI